MRISRFYLPMAVSVIFMTASCGESPESGTQEREESTQEEPATQSQAETASDTVRLEIEGNDQMEYNKDRLQVKAGQIVVLTLKHVGEMPENAMGHNWVLLQQGADRTAFAEDAIEAKDNDYIPEGRTDDVIANTEMIGGGESVTITFEAPAKGIYTYLCTFPGHHLKMNGKFIVQ